MALSVFLVDHDAILAENSNQENIFLGASHGIMQRAFSVFISGVQVRVEIDEHFGGIEVARLARVHQSSTVFAIDIVYVGFGLLAQHFQSLTLKKNK